MASKLSSTDAHKYQPTLPKPNHLRIHPFITNSKSFAVSKQSYTINMSTFTVTVPADAGAGPLRQAITSANAVPNSTIDFSAGFTINLASALPTITQPITITGNNNTINGASVTYCLYVQLAAQASVSISNLTFSQGYTTNGTAGLQVTNANLALVDVNVSGCVVDYDAQTTFGVG